MAPESTPDRRTTLMGVAVAMEAETGITLFAASDSPVWIGAEPAIGAAPPSRSGRDDR